MLAGGNVSFAKVLNDIKEPLVRKLQQFWRQVTCCMTSASSVHVVCEKFKPVQSVQRCAMEMTWSLERFGKSSMLLTQT